MIKKRYNQEENRASRAIVIVLVHPNCSRIDDLTNDILRVIPLDLRQIASASRPQHCNLRYMQAVVQEFAQPRVSYRAYQEPKSLYDV